MLIKLFEIICYYFACHRNRQPEEVTAQKVYRDTYVPPPRHRSFPPGHMDEYKRDTCGFCIKVIEYIDMLYVHMYKLCVCRRLRKFFLFYGVVGAECAGQGLAKSCHWIGKTCHVFMKA